VEAGMIISKIRSEFKEQSVGATVDLVLRRLMLKFWRRRALLTVSENSRSVRLNIRTSTTDAEVVWQCFSLKQYQIPVVVGGPRIHRDAVYLKYKSIVESGRKPLIIDCGANIGASTAWFKMKYPEATIVAIEPGPDNYKALVENCQQFSEIEAIEAGIGPADTFAFLQDGGGGAWGYQTGTEETAVRIKMISLATLLEAKNNSYAPFILKIDIEGAEKHLFEPDTYSVFNRFPVIIFESHDFYMPAKRTSSPFFRFHSDTGRDFLFGSENIFSIDMKPAATLGEPANVSRSVAAPVA
jgi:FkbM family methyltransferase